MISTQYLIDVQLHPDKQPDFSAYPFCLPAVRHLGKLAFDPAVTFIVGENGSGKSTLLEGLAIALGFNAEGGSKNFGFSTHASHSCLHEFLRIARGVRMPQDGFFLRAESFFNVATQVERLGVSGYGEKSLHEQSHGESFMALLQNRFRGKGLYILDEPEAALSPQRQLSALARIHQLVQAGSQFVIATHSPILMAYPEASIYVCSDQGIRQRAYEDTEHYEVMHDFMANPRRMLKTLLETPKEP
ncbi:AAA family ATPase [Pseudoduganella violaceinigra]|uniref:AAA family ATPase n=1 Tax=Pseudoduganella violaceinigra TaxID=246602 RepID=UPI00040EE5F1|nr:AAA family ATPase [Pseudoduganella violaceinigra]